MTMCTYLDQVGATYYFRRSVPDDIRGKLLTANGNPRSEFKISLKTKDRETAKRLIPAHTIETDRVFAEARAIIHAPAPGPRISNPADWITERELNGIAQLDADNSRREDKREKLGPMIAFLEGRLSGSTERMSPELRAMKFIRDDEIFSRRLVEDKLRAARADVAELSRRVPSNAHNADTVPTQAAKAISIIGAYDAYAKAQGLKAVVATEGHASVADFMKFVGHDDAVKLSEDNVRDWRDALAAETTNRSRPRDPQTVKKRVGILSSLLRWAVEERLLPSNPAAGVVVRVPRKARLRNSDFTAAEAKAILSASLLPSPGRLSVQNKLARRWIPWLCAYTGARVGEMSQLRGQDVTQIDGIWVVRITPEAGTVKDGNARIVPLHPHLIEQGFLAVAKNDGPIFYDPAMQRVQSRDNRHFKKVGERLATWVRKDVGITDPAIMPNHGWRHTFKTQAISANMLERTSDAITGHAAKTVGQTYGSVPIKAMSEAINKMPRYEIDGGMGKQGF
jgi:integrase